MTVYPHNIRDSKILVFVEDFSSYHIDIMRSGVQDYFDQSDRALSYVPLPITKLTRFFGNTTHDKVTVIGALRESDSVEYFEEIRIPYLNLIEQNKQSIWGLDLKFEGEGTMAANYFINELHVENLGIIGRFDEASHNRRCHEFKQAAKKKNLSVNQCSIKKRQRYRNPLVDSLKSQLSFHDDSIQEFLKKQKKPAGIFCADDRIAFDCHFNCEVLGIAVPNEIAILGIGSRSQAKPDWTRPISIIEMDHSRLGFTAARLMNEYVMTGKAPKPIRLTPSGICHNKTTVQQKIKDPLMQKALSMIMKEPNITVKDIAKKLRLNRNALDNRFYRSTNTTVSKMIEQERFRRAKELLRNQKYNIESIAGLAGYPNRKSMRRSFHRFTKMSPHKFRELEKNRSNTPLKR